MTLAVKDHIRFYSSPDLKNWKEESQFGKGLGAQGGVWECPDLFLMDDKWKKNLDSYRQHKSWWSKWWISHPILPWKF